MSEYGECEFIIYMFCLNFGILEGVLTKLLLLENLKIVTKAELLISTGHGIALGLGPS